MYIITDDQDFATANSHVMPRMSQYIATHGVNYTHFYTPMSICCPSRVGFLRGQHGHSHNVTNVTPPYGGWDLFVSQGYRKDHLPTWLQAAGYNTYYTGKLMNGNAVTNWKNSPVLGFNKSALLLDPYTYVYNNASMSIDNKKIAKYENKYSTDVIRDFGLDYLEEAASQDKPFFVGIAPIGPHSETIIKGVVPTFNPPVPAQRHANLYKDEVAPRKTSFNPEQPSGAGYVEQLSRLNDTEVEYIDSWYRNRLRALLSVDELVGAVMKKAEDLGILDNTYFIYTSDNGFSTGEHRRQPGKTLGYEEDIRVPLFVRGPGIKPLSQDDAMHRTIDLTATIVELAGGEPTYNLDGRVMKWPNTNPSFRQKGTATHHLSEFWVSGPPGEEKYAVLPNVVSKYRTLRVKDANFDYAYTLWCTGQRELYDMKVDSVQMDNLLGNQSFYTSLTSSNSQAQRIASRMDALLLSLKTCQGSLCRRLWYNLFPEGEVHTMEQALSPSWDLYFDTRPRVHFDNCRDGFFPSEELPIWRTGLVYTNTSLLASSS